MDLALRVHLFSTSVSRVERCERHSRLGPGIIAAPVCAAHAEECSVAAFSRTGEDCARRAVERTALVYCVRKAIQSEGRFTDHEHFDSESLRFDDRVRACRHVRRYFGG
jgi:hypothetical protein